MDITAAAAATLKQLENNSPHLTALARLRVLLYNNVLSVYTLPSLINPLTRPQCPSCFLLYYFLTGASRSYTPYGFTVRIDRLQQPN